MAKIGKKTRLTEEALAPLAAVAARPRYIYFILLSLRTHATHTHTRTHRVVDIIFFCLNSSSRASGCICTGKKEKCGATKHTVANKQVTSLNQQRHFSF